MVAAKTIDQFNKDLAEYQEIKYFVVKNVALDKLDEAGFQDLTARVLVLARRALINKNFAEQSYSPEGITELLSYPVVKRYGLETNPEVHVTSKDHQRVVGSGFLHLEAHNRENGFLFGVYEDPAAIYRGVEQVILNIILRHAKRVRIRKLTALMPKFVDTEKFYSEYRFTKAESRMTDESLYHEMQLLL
ncbi:MAG TPA: hypothetical protein VJJ52_00060 [Candidatus Nanoarchaeia archaeon]|nr:hypothetical protein [Candidatus Nanoarchaeia archaeon]